MQLEVDFPSSLKLLTIFVLNSNFNRQKEVPKKGEYSFDFDFETQETNQQLNITLTGSITSTPNVFEATVSIYAEFSLEHCDDLTEIQKDIIKQNSTIAIMFPYLRAEMTMLMSQTGLHTIVIPPININAYLDYKNNIKQYEKEFQKLERLQQDKCTIENKTKSTKDKG